MASKEVNPYLEHRRSRLIANDTLLRSLGLLPSTIVASQPVITSPIPKSESSPSHVPRQSQLSRSTSSDDANSEGRNGSDGFAYETPRQESAKAKHHEPVEPEMGLRRSARRVCPREKKFMEEDFEKKANQYKKEMAKKLGTVRVADYPYKPHPEKVLSGSSPTTVANEYSSSQPPEEDENREWSFEKGSFMSVVWEVYEPIHQRNRQYVVVEEEDDDNEEEEDDEESEHEEKPENKTPTRPEVPWRRMSLLDPSTWKTPVAKRARNISSPSDPSSSSSDDDKDDSRKRRAVKKVIMPVRRYFLDLPHETDFYATLISTVSKEKQHLYDMTGSLLTAVPAHSVGHSACTGVLKLQIPDWLPLGTYTLEIGSSKRRVRSTTQPFTIFEAVGHYDETNVGVWCVCGNTDARQDYTGSWVSCTACAAWQHWSCYMRVSESRKNKEKNKDFVLERVVLSQDEPEDGDGTAAAQVTQATTTTTPGGSANLSAASPSASSDQNQALDTQQQKKRRLTRKERQDLTESLAARVSHVHLLLPDVLPTPEEDFLCWACQPLLHLADGSNEEVTQSHLQALGERCELMINMIGAASGGYFRKVLAGGEDSAWTVLCATPPHVVKFLRTLINPEKDKVCADLGAGTGAFSAALAPGSLCVEINEKRYAKGKVNRSDMEWLNIDALTPEFYRDRLGKFDLIISNPDFEVGLQFLFLGLCLIKNACLSDRGQSEKPDDEKSGRLIFLLPSDFFEASNLRARIFKLLDFHIETEYKLGHLCYYEDQPQSQKLTCDSLFVLRPGRAGPAKYEHKVVNARLAGML